jgi:hypothetical protein
MESIYHVVTICVNETSWAHVWRLRSRYLGTGCDTGIGMTSAHLPFFSSLRIYLIASNIKALALSIASLDWMWYTDAKAAFILTCW